MKTLLLSQEEVKSLITMEEVVEICDKTFQGMGDGTVINPTKLTLDLGEASSYPPYEGFMNAMPAYIGWLDVAGLKWVGGFLGERKKMGLPFLTSLILLINPRIGNFKAVMEGAHITNLRTGAQTAIFLKYLVDKKSINIGLYGAGMQGHTQTEAISKVLDIDELRVYDINKEAALRFARNMEHAVKGRIIIVDDPKEAAEGDAIITVTQSKERFVKNDWIKPGSMFFPMGSYQECENDLILNMDKIIVDHVQQSLHRGALKELNHQGKITEEHISATIGELAIGKKTIKINNNERFLCIPIGTGALDVAVAEIVYNKAVKRGIGGSYEFA
ncbi:MAG TPA: ornithine cyclodeaminase family protein [Clostridiaceae bacterium]|nr:ornithine cyclodeaminase family protein [Clostridiaceae bacterium]